jgi:hypothetical protein
MFGAVGITLSAAADLDDLVESDEMIIHPLDAVGSGGFGLRDYGAHPVWVTWL